MKFPIGAMSVGDILDRGLKLLFSRLAIFFAIELIVLSPILVLKLALPDLAVNPFGGLLVVLPLFLLAPIGTAAMLRVIMQEYIGERVSLGEAFRFAFSRFLPLLGTTILSSLIITAGMFACCVPGIYFAIVYAFVSQVVVAEKLAGMDALSRSKSLVEGYFGRVIGVLFLIGLIMGFLNMVVAQTTAALLPFVEVVPSKDPFSAIRISSYPNFAVNQIVDTLVQILVTTYTTICGTLLYFDQRNRKEGFDLQLEAEKFSRWTEHFGDRSRGAEAEPGDTSIQQPDAGIQPSAGAAPPDTGIQPADPDAPPPPGTEPRL
jgi:hypothetical protein